MASRRVIEGFDDESWTVSSAGVVRRGWRKKQITNLIAYLPTVDLGPEYGGPVPAPGCAKDCPRCLWENDSHTRDRGPMPVSHKPSTLRLLEEVVLYAFHGAPPLQDGSGRSIPRYAWRAAYLDKKVWKPNNVPNCTADNLRWEPDENSVEWLALHGAKRRHALRGLIAA